MIRFFVRWGFRLLVLGIVGIVALILLKDTLAKALLESQIESRTGMDVRIGSLEVGLLTPTITIQNARVYNLAEFGGSPFVEVPDLYIEYFPGAFVRRGLHFKLVRLSVSAMNIIEGKGGKTNLVLALPDGGPSTVTPTPVSVLGFQFQGIDTLNLTLGTVHYSSLRRPGRTTEVSLALKNEVIQNVTSIEQLRELVVKSMFRKGITIVTDGPQSPRASSRK